MYLVRVIAAIKKTDRNPLLLETTHPRDHRQLTQIITANTAPPHGGPWHVKFRGPEAVFNMELGSLSEQKTLGQGHRERVALTAAGHRVQAKVTAKKDPGSQRNTWVCSRNHKVESGEGRWRVEIKIRAVQSQTVAGHGERRPWQ